MGKGIGFPVFKWTFAEQIVQGLLAIIEEARLDRQARFFKSSLNQKYVMRIIFGNEHTNCSLAKVKLVNKEIKNVNQVRPGTTSVLVVFVFSTAFQTL